MIPIEWLILGVLGTLLLGAMVNVSFSSGRIVSQLESLNQKVTGLLEWIKSIEQRTEDHEKRLLNLEFARQHRGDRPPSASAQANGPT